MPSIFITRFTIVLTLSPCAAYTSHWVRLSLVQILVQIQFHRNRVKLNCFTAKWPHKSLVLGYLCTSWHKFLFRKNLIFGLFSDVISGYYFCTFWIWKKNCTFCTCFEMSISKFVHTTSRRRHIMIGMASLLMRLLDTGLISPNEAHCYGKIDFISPQDHYTRVVI